jgi:putative inorganic carbon (HCO3(-)) transporter
MGIGPMNYVCSSPELIGHPHNFPLQLAAEWGIPVALAACFIFLVLVWRVSQNVRQGRHDCAQDGELAGLLLTGVLAAALHACLSGVMVMPASQVAGMLICGMLLGLSPLRQNQRPTPAYRRWGIPGLLLSVCLLALGFHELRTMEIRAPQLAPGEDMRPRVWQNAKVCKLYTMPSEVRN